ncbi:DHA2 family efflux MFS transporter permease subunit [Actinomadura sp. 9N407]|uniref:DHA2 family efflux MFS transporter permease subunit n=1 Tax=Actinomadura sp. 9N407 TaxID=3375154 RepID=UPI0037A13E64
MTRGRYRWALAVVATSAFMITMDNTVVANALPTMMRELGMSNAAKDWVATGYILMFSCLMIAGGRLADVYGCRLTFITGMAIFTGASAVCGLAPDVSVLIIGRIVQGAGAALALPATLVMVTVGRTDKQRSLGTIVWVGAAGGATALGPTIGGIIVSHWPWGWIFLINIPAGIMVIALGTVVLTSKGENRTARIDMPGVLISATMLFALTYGLETGRQMGWTDPAVLSVFALAGIALLCFIVVESWAPDPMMDMRFFRNRVFVGGLLSQMMWGIGFNGMIFYSATFLQRYLGFSPPEAGLVMLPSAIAVMVLTPVSFWVAARLGPRVAVGGGMAAMALGMVMFSLLRRDDGFAELMPGVLVVGIGSAMCMPLAMYVLKSVPDEQAGLASGILNVIREASGAFGIAIVGLLIHEIPHEDASDAALESFRHGTASGLVLGATLVLIGGVISALTLPSRRGWFGPKHGRRAFPNPASPEPARKPVRKAVREPVREPVPVAVAEPVSVPAGPGPPNGRPHGLDPFPDSPEPGGNGAVSPLEALGMTPRDGLSVITTGPTHTAPPRYPAYPPAEEPPPAATPVAPIPAMPPPHAAPPNAAPPRASPPQAPHVPPPQAWPLQPTPPDATPPKVWSAPAGPVPTAVPEPELVPEPVTEPVPEGDEGQWPPPPPTGWYQPYVPEEPADPSSGSPRRDVW